MSKCIKWIYKNSAIVRFFLAVLRGCLQFVIVVFPDHTLLLFLGFFLELLNSNDGFLFLTYHLATCCIIFVDDVTELIQSRLKQRLKSTLNNEQMHQMDLQELSNSKCNC